MILIETCHRSKNTCSTVIAWVTNYEKLSILVFLDIYAVALVLVNEMFVLTALREE